MKANVSKPMLRQNNISDRFISDVEKLTSSILIYFPKFFDDFNNWEYGTGRNAGKDFKRIFDHAKRLKDKIPKTHEFRQA